MSKFAVALTTQCNLRCRCCPNTNKYQTSTKTNLPETVIRNIKFGVEFGATIIGFSNGISEPLLYPAEYMKDVVEFCDNNNKITSLYCFTSLSDINVDNLYILATSKKISLHISLYGVDEESFFKKTGKHKFNELISNIKIMQDLNIKHKFDNRTPNELSEQFMKDNGITTYENVPDFKWTTKNSKLKNKLIPERNGICNGAIIDNGIDYDGNVLLCSGMDIKSEMTLGHVSEDINIIKSRLNYILKMQKFNLFSDLCVECNAYRAVNKKDNDV